MFFFVLYRFYKQKCIFAHYKQRFYYTYSSKWTANVHTSNEIWRFSQQIDLPKLQATHAVAAAAAMVAIFARRPPMFQRFAIWGVTKTIKIKWPPKTPQNTKNKKYRKDNLRSHNKTDSKTISKTIKAFETIQPAFRIQMVLVRWRADSQ